MMIYIDQDTGKMVNIYTPYKDFSRLTTPESRAAAGVVGIEEDPAPEGFSYDTHERKEHWEATQRPYITYPNKPAEEVRRIKIAQFVQAMEGHYDAVAQVKKYDNRLTCTLRAGYAGPFQSDGIAFAQWMDSINVYGYQVMAEALAGTRPMPTVEAFIAELPPMVWPE